MPETDFARLAPAKGSRVAVLGGCGGIGRALVQTAIGIGLKVAVLDLPRSIAEAPPAEGAALSLPLHATDETQVSNAFARRGEALGGGRDGLVNVAGFPTRHVPFSELSLAEWDETVNGSLRTTYLSCRAALPLLQASVGRGGC